MDLEFNDFDQDGNFIKFFFILLDRLLPKMEDPKVFAVTCKPGFEKETVA